MQKLTLNRRSVLLVLASVYIFPLLLVFFSLSVPPADLPLCGLLFVLAGVGLIIARRETRVWRIFWITALILSVILGILEIVAGERIKHQNSGNESHLKYTYDFISLHEG
jgi:hypothetical protein